MDFYAKLISKDAIQLWVKKGLWPNGKDPYLRLYDRYKPVLTLKPISVADQGDHYMYMLPVHYDFNVDNDYSILDILNNVIKLDISVLGDYDDFDKKYRYDGPLGAVYSKEETSFYVFAPFATTMFVHYKPVGQDSVLSVPMERMECGVYKVTIKGDLDGASYLYAGCNGGKFFTSTDPYSFGLSSNSRYSFVINPEKVLSRPLNKENLSPLDLTKMSVYEVNVRDMTSLTDIQNKGTYLALTKEGLKTEDGFPIGLDYLKSLGVTHIQLLPVLDFQTIDDDDPFKTYNWGYDPVNYFTPEGSYSTEPNDPYKRLFELRDMVAGFHKNGLRAVFDVVYNHVFNKNTNSLDILAPGYYFRKNKDGSLSNGSFCGNDLESRHYMCRRLIKDSLRHAIEFFGADGFRFDLMGIIDSTTVKEAYESLKKDYPDLVFYGEGWDMPTALPYQEKTCDGNGLSLPDIGFFNGFFREASKGGMGDSIGSCGYLDGDLGKIEDFKYAFAGSVMDMGRRPMFVKTSQSINFVECHDNETLFDKIEYVCKNELPDEKKKRINLINACTVFAQGIPFFHMGQEFGGTKRGYGNTYNAGDELNGFNYDLASQNRDMIKFLREALELKKQLPISFLEREDIVKHICFENIGHGALKITYNFDDGEAYHIIINPSKETFSYNFSKYVKIIFNGKGKIPSGCDFYSQLLIVPAISFNICYQQKD